MLRFVGTINGKPADEIKLKYNGKIKVLKKDQTIDVRDYDVNNKNVKGVEKNVLTKYPGSFKQEKTVDDPRIESEYKDQIKSLSADLERLTKENEALRKNVGELQDKHAGSAAEVNAIQKQINSYKAEAEKAADGKKDLEDEIEKLRGQLDTGKKGKK